MGLTDSSSTARRPTQLEHARVAGGIVLALALVVLGAWLAVGGRDVIQDVLTLYLFTPLILTAVSLGWARDADVGVRKFVAAGLATLVPAVPVAAVSATAPETLLIAVPAVGLLLVLPAWRCFSAARAVHRGDGAAARRAARFNGWWVSIPALALAAALALWTIATPYSAYGLQVGITLAVIAGYTAPALVAGLMAGSARWWLRRNVGY